MKRGRKERDWREVLYGNGVEGSEREMEGSGFLRPTLLFYLTCNYKERIVFILQGTDFVLVSLGQRKYRLAVGLTERG